MAVFLVRWSYYGDSGSPMAVDAGYETQVTRVYSGESQISARGYSRKIPVIRKSLEPVGEIQRQPQCCESQQRCVIGHRYETVVQSMLNSVDRYRLPLSRTMSAGYLENQSLPLFSTVLNPCLDNLIVIMFQSLGSFTFLDGTGIIYSYSRIVRASLETKDQRNFDAISHDADTLKQSM